MEILAILVGLLALIIGCIIAAFVKGQDSGKTAQSLTDQKETVKESEAGQDLAQKQASAAVNMPTPDETLELMKNDPQSF